MHSSKALLRLTGFVIGVFVFFLFCFFTLAGARPGEAILDLSPQSGRPLAVPGEVLVQFRPDLSSAAIRATASTGESLFPASSGKGKRIFRLKLQPGESIEKRVAELSARPEVLYAQPNYLYYTAFVPDDPLYSGQWSLPKIGLPAAWDIASGDPVAYVAVVDTGIALDHEDLQSALWTNASEDAGLPGVDDDGNGFIDDLHGANTASPADPISDDQGHGTHVAGIIGATTNNAVGVAGTCPSVKLIIVKANSTGSESFSSQSLVDALAYIRNLKETKGLDIVAVNASWGVSGASSYDPLLSGAIRELLDSGILFVAAAGNAARNNDIEALSFRPASYYIPNILSVAATNPDDSPASFSNYGRRTVHLGAPGTDILSTAIPASTYIEKSGTSMAAPHVTGVLALLKARNPGWDWIAIKNKLLCSGTPVPSLSSKTITGRRLLAAGDSGLGALTGSGQALGVRLRPLADSLDLSPGESLDLAALNILDEKSLGSLFVPLSINGETLPPVLLEDNGLSFDTVSGDGIASASWTVPASADSTYRFSFPDGDLTVTVQLSPPPPQPSSSGGGGGCRTAPMSVLGLLIIAPAALMAFGKSR